MKRVHELADAPGSKSRLTITPTRVTVKVAKKHLAVKAVLGEVGRRIAEDISLVKTVRGVFDLEHGRITLYTESHTLTMTYDFEGNRL